MAAADTFTSTMTRLQHTIHLPTYDAITKTGCSMHTIYIYQCKYMVAACIQYNTFTNSKTCCGIGYIYQRKDTAAC